MRQYPFYLVSTPIGNLDDLSPRAVEILRSVDLVLAEDTRRTKIILSRHAISTRVRSFHDHNKEKVTPEILSQLDRGDRVALVSDAGTPAISDPGYYIVRALVERGIEFTAVPGPSAILTALVLSGLPTDRFTFYGYMPRKKGEREKAVLEAGGNRGTAIFFESPHRLLGTLEVFSRLLPERDLVIARELTKMHEEVRRGNASELREYFAGTGVRGELVILVRGRGKKSVRLDT
jgi:16S rRNA (cytidine1402-2'-O)-methyltransferase